MRSVPLQSKKNGRNRVQEKGKCDLYPYREKNARNRVQEKEKYDLYPCGARSVVERGLCTYKGSVLWKYRMVLRMYFASVDLTRRVYCVTIDGSSRTDDRSRASG